MSAMASFSVCHAARTPASAYLRYSLYLSSSSRIVARPSDPSRAASSSTSRTCSALTTSRSSSSSRSQSSDTASTRSTSACVQRRGSFATRRSSSLACSELAVGAELTLPPRS